MSQSVHLLPNINQVLDLSNNIYDGHPIVFKVDMEDKLDKKIDFRGAVEDSNWGVLLTLECKEQPVEDFFLSYIWENDALHIYQTRKVFHHQYVIVMVFCRELPILY